MRQTEIQGHGAASAGVLLPLILDQTEVVQLLLALCLRHLTLVGGEEEKQW